MPTTDLSTAPPEFVDFTWHGWNGGECDRLHLAMDEMTGVTRIQRTGGNSGIRAYFNPQVTDGDAVIAEVCKAADHIKPGYNFSA